MCPHFCWLHRCFVQLKVHSNAKFSQAQQCGRAKLPNHSRQLSPSKATSGENEQTTKTTYFKQCWKHTGHPLSILMPPPISSSFAHLCLLPFQIQFYSPQPTRAGNPTQKTYMGWGRDKFLAPITRSPGTDLAPGWARPEVWHALQSFSLSACSLLMAKGVTCLPWFKSS